MYSNLITIGRDPNCDIVVDEQWDTVSNNHADIEQRDNELIFYDHSSNGSVINGQKIHNTYVGIYSGDKILLAGVYELDWNILDSYFERRRRPTVTKNIKGGIDDNDNESEYFVKGKDNNINGSTVQSDDKDHTDNCNYGHTNTFTQAEIDSTLDRWNWGAFFCTWLWAAFHKKYWPLLIIVLGCVPYIGQICIVFLSVYLGLNGYRIAWNCGKHGDFEQFLRVEHKWMLFGLFWFIISLVVSACVLNIALQLF